MTLSAQASQVARISGIAVPDSKLANETTEFIRDQNRPCCLTTPAASTILAHSQASAVASSSTPNFSTQALGIDYASFADSDRNSVVQAFPRTAHFKEDILQAFCEGIQHKPETSFGNVKADVLADKDQDFHRAYFCSVIRDSSWRS
jgi:hypothetical protein